MRRHRVLVRDLAAGRRLVHGAEAHHLRNVLRVAAGTEVLAFDGKGFEAPARVAAVGPEGVELELARPQPGRLEAGLDLTLAVALLKGDKLSDVVRKGTELGVARVRLFVAAQGDVPSVSEGKLRRYRRVAEEAAKQCGRPRVPEVAAPVPLTELPLKGKSLVAVPGAEATLREALTERNGTSLTIVTGPEGGLTEDEVAFLRRRGARAVRLAPRILRAETAPIALAAAVLVPDAL